MKKMTTHRTGKTAKGMLANNRVKAGKPANPVKTGSHRQTTGTPRFKDTHRS